MNSKHTNSTDDEHKHEPEKAGSRDEVIGQLRRIMPVRALSFWEHKLIAEKQADQLLASLNQTGPAADLSWMTELSRFQVVLIPQWRMDGLSGITTWKDGRWVMGVNMGNPPARRRFTLAHEFKHAPDANRDTVTYRSVTDAQRELIADYFAACYLMPKAWLRHVWTRGIQDPEALAGLFKVSLAAMNRRLHALGYLDEPGDRDRPVASYFRLNQLPLNLAA